MQKSLNSSRILIAVKSCGPDTQNGANEAIRRTWAKDVPKSVDCFFFVGVPSSRLDEVWIECADTYEALPLKTRAILKLALRHDYDFIFLCDTDTFVIPERLLECGFQDYDLTGRISGNTEKGKYYSWPSGGAGYILSARAARKVVDAPIGREWAEDRMVGQILGPFIERGELTSFNHMGFGPDEAETTDVTTHFCARGLHRKYDPKWMYKMHKRNMVKA